jgi:uncharacterized protein YbjT (DUF2867 family)
VERPASRKEAIAVSRIAVAGGTGLVGRHVTEALRRAGHEVVTLTRASGVDLVAGDGLAGALRGVRAVIDVTNTPATDRDDARAFFGAVTGNLLAAEEQAGVAQHVALSIVGVDRVKGNGHYAGKRRQEQLVADGPVAATIVRATQFHEFAGMVVSWTRQGDVAAVPPLLVQPAAAADVGEVLARAALDDPAGTIELGGPEPQDLVDMARRTLAAQGRSLRLVPTWQGLFSVEMAGEVLLPGPGALIAPTTFDQWLAAQPGAGGDSGDRLTAARAQE